MQKKNQLAPVGICGKAGNFFLNLFWVVAWLGRWCLRLLRSLLRGKG